MKNIFKKLFAITVIAVASSCSQFDDTVNPSQLTPAAADPDLVISAIQLNFATFFNSSNNLVDQLVRMQAMAGGYRYQTALTPTAGDGTWFWAYQATLNNIKTILPIAQSKKLTTHVAMCKIFQAYTFLTLVDIFGDVPQTEALLGAADFSPKVDNGSDVYAYAIGLLGEARTELAKTGSDAGANIASGIDLYYGGSRANWTALANSLELKAWLNIRMIASRTAEADAKITALLTSNLIDTPAENFTFKYGTATVPDSRHPLYNQYYGPNAGAAGGYIANYFLNELYQGRGVQDPRWRYYFYRQVGSISPVINGFDPKALGCTPGAPPPQYVTSGSVFCVFEPGFYGRDHGDGSGTPPDSPVITCAGVYPAGGRPDNNNVVNTTYSGTTKRGDGANGAGIHPIYMYFFTDFVKAEIAARRGDPTGAQTAMTNGINNSITAVKAFAVSKSQAVSPASLEPSTANYLNAVSTAYTAAANKLDVIGREYYVALWGNGVEAYNNYRRTGAPGNFQPTLQTGAGPWLRRVIYPQSFVALAGSTTQLDPNVVNKIFWDTNPATLN